MRSENQRLKEMAEGQMKFIDEYKKETNELRSRLLEVSNIVQGRDTKQINSSSNDISGNDSRRERRKGAASISC